MSGPEFQYCARHGGQIPHWAESIYSECPMCKAKAMLVMFRERSEAVFDAFTDWEEYGQQRQAIALADAVRELGELLPTDAAPLREE